MYIDMLKNLSIKEKLHIYDRAIAHLKSPQNEISVPFDLLDRVDNGSIELATAILDNDYNAVENIILKNQAQENYADLNFSIQVISKQNDDKYALRATPTLLAALTGNKRIFDLLLNNGGNINNSARIYIQEGFSVEKYQNISGIFEYQLDCNAKGLAILAGHDNIFESFYKNSNIFSAEKQDENLMSSSVKTFLHSKTFDTSKITKNKYLSTLDELLNNDLATSSVERKLNNLTQSNIVYKNDSPEYLSFQELALKKGLQQTISHLIYNKGFDMPRNALHNSFDNIRWELGNIRSAKDFREYLDKKPYLIHFKSPEEGLTFLQEVIKYVPFSDAVKYTIEKGAAVNEKSVIRRLSALNICKSYAKSNEIYKTLKALGAKEIDSDNSNDPSKIDDNTNTDTTNKTDKTDKTDTTDKTGKTDKTDTIDNTDSSDNTDNNNNTDKNSKVDTTTEFFNFDDYTFEQLKKLSEQDPDKYKPYLLAYFVKTNNAVGVNHLLSNGINADFAISNKNCDTLLTLACRKDVKSPQIIKLLILYGADPQRPDGAGIAPLSFLNTDFAAHKAFLRQLHDTYDIKYQNLLMQEYIRNENIEGVKALLEKGADANLILDNYGKDTPLTLACCYNKQNPEIIRMLIKYGAHPLFRNKLGMEPIKSLESNTDSYSAFFDTLYETTGVKYSRILIKEYISEQKAEKLLQILLQGVNPNFEFEANYNETPLTLACKNKNPNPEIIRTLIKSGVDPVKPNRDGETPFSLLSDKAAIRSIFADELLQSYGTKYSNLLMYEYITTGDADKLKALLEKNVPVNILFDNIDNDSPLTLACCHPENPSNQNPEIIKLLISYGADPMLINANSKSAFDSILPNSTQYHVFLEALLNKSPLKYEGLLLHEYILNERLDKVEQLLNEGANANIRFNNDKQDTPLTLASTTHFDNEALFALLIKHGANPLDENILKECPLKMISKDTNLYKILFKEVFKYDPYENFDYLQLSIINSGKFEYLEKLYSEGFKPEFQNKLNGMNILHYICKNSNDSRALNLLIKYGASVNEINPINGKTPLMIYLEQHKNAFAKDNLADILIANHASIDAQNPKNGRTALHYAILSSDKDLNNVFGLIKRGASPTVTDSYGNNVFHLQNFGRILQNTESEQIKNQVTTLMNIFCEHGVIIDKKNIHDVTPLHIAVNSKYPKAIELLLERGADVNIQDSFGQIPFQIVLANQSLKPYETSLARTFARLGTDVRITDKSSNSLTWIVSNREYSAILQSPENEVTTFHNVSQSGIWRGSNWKNDKYICSKVKNIDRQYQKGVIDLLMQISESVKTNSKTLPDKLSYEMADKFNRLCCRIRDGSYNDRTMKEAWKYLKINDYRKINYETQILTKLIKQLRYILLKGKILETKTPNDERTNAICDFNDLLDRTRSQMKIIKDVPFEEALTVLMR